MSVVRLTYVLAHKLYCPQTVVNNLLAVYYVFELAEAKAVLHTVTQRNILCFRLLMYRKPLTSLTMTRQAELRCTVLVHSPCVLCTARVGRALLKHVLLEKWNALTSAAADASRGRGFWGLHLSNLFPRPSALISVWVERKPFRPRTI